MQSMSSRARPISVARFMVPTIHVCNKTLGVRGGRLQRHEIETTTVGCGVKDLLQLEWPAPYGSVVPGSSALSEKSRSDWQIRQLAYLLWAVSAPKKEGRLLSMNKGRSAQRGQRSRPFTRRLNCHSIWITTFLPRRPIHTATPP